MSRLDDLARALYQTPMRLVRQQFTCTDCGLSGEEGFTGVPTTGKIFCVACKQRRGLTYLFDARTWDEIAGER